MAQRGNPNTSYMGESPDQIVSKFMEEYNVPGLTLAIVEAPYIPLYAGYGVAQIEPYSQTLSLASPTLFNIGQMSQGYIAISIMQLIEKDKINLNDPINKYIPQLSKFKNITIKHLLQNASGLQDFTKEVNFDPSKPYSPKDFLRNINSELLFMPGTDVRLSVTNFVLLSMVIEKVTGKSYQNHIKKNQIERLAINGTVFANDTERIKEIVREESPRISFRKKGFSSFIDPIERAVGYTDSKDHNKNIASQKHNIVSPIPGYNDLLSDGRSISIWDIGLASHFLITKEAIRNFMYKPTKLDNGKEIPAMANWNFTRHKGFVDIKGSVPGFSSYLSRFTNYDELVCVTLLANKDDIDLVDLGRRIAAAYNSKISNSVNPKYINTMESAFSVEETIARIEEQLKRTNTPVFAKYDHSKNATEVNLELSPTQVIVFGNPTVGTVLMQDSQSIAIHLPLKILVREEKQDDKEREPRVWVEWENLDELAKIYKIEDKKLIEKIKKFVRDIVTSVIYVN